MEETNLIIDSLSGLHYTGLFLMALLSNLFIPVPEELVLLGVGYLTGIKTFSYTSAMIIFIVGMLVSDIFLYTLAKKGNKLVQKPMRVLQKRGVLSNKEFARKHIRKIIFFSRFLVYLRFTGPVMAGWLKLKTRIFIIYDFFALVIYVNIVMGLGNYFHKQIFAITEGVVQFRNYLITAVLILITIWLFRTIRRKWLKFIRQFDDYVPTIIPGLEQKMKEEESKKTVDPLVVNKTK